MSYSSEVLADSPVSYWRLGEPSGTTATDQQGISNGTYTGGFTLGQTGLITGDADTAVLFNGTTGFVTVPHNAAYNFGTGDFSLECWFSLTSIGVTIRWFLSKDSQFGWGIDGSGFMFLDNFVNGAFTSTSPINGNTVRHHAVMTRSGSTYLAYLDGIPFPGASTTRTFTASSNPLTIGEENDGIGRFPGVLDEVAVYNTALSPARIWAHAVAGGIGPLVPYDVGQTQVGFSEPGYGIFHPRSELKIDSGSTVQNLIRTLDDTLGFGDTVTRLGTFVRSNADSLTIGNTVSRLGTFLRTNADSLTFADVVNASRAFARTATDALGFADAVTRLGTFTRTAADSLTLGNTVTRLGTFVRTASDSLGFSDAVTRLGTFLRTAADSLSFSDAVNAIKLIVRTVADSLTMGNTVSRLGTFVRTNADSLTIGNTVSRLGTFLRTASDALSFSDAVTAINQTVITVIGGIAPVGRAVASAVSSIASHLRPGGGATNSTPSGKADHQEPKH